MLYRADPGKLHLDIARRQALEESGARALV
jgi:hypothetical protein